MKQIIEEPRERGNYASVERSPEEKERIKKWVDVISEDIKKRNELRK